jgi:hypothetical protein
MKRLTNEKALRLHKMGFNLVLLGRSGDDLKRPVLKGWQTAVYEPEQIAAWSTRANLGLRCGRQRNSLPRASRGDWSLIVLDFDEEAGRIFPQWRRQAERIISYQSVIVTSGRGYHVYFYTRDDHRSRTLAGRYSVGEDGRKRLHKFIEILGRGRQVVSAGSRHPNGRRYHFLTGTTYADIPYLTERQFQRLAALSRTFDQRPARSKKKNFQPVALLDDGAGIGDCLDYARRFIGSQEFIESNGDIRILGQGGLLITPDGRGWYSFSDDTGGGLTDLIAWHRSWAGEGDAC